MQKNIWVRLVPLVLGVLLVPAVSAMGSPLRAARGDYTTLTRDGCSFVGTATWTNQPSTATVRFYLQANYGDGPVTLAFFDAAPSSTGASGTATASWTLEPAAATGNYWTDADLLDSNGGLLQILTRKTGKPLRAPCV